MKISLCMIVRDEANNLPICLESASNLVDEIIVVDTGSEDDTRRVATEMGAKVFGFEWCNDFSAARNESLKHATGDWILVLDADEVLAEAIVPDIRSATQSEETLVINLMRQEVGAVQSPYSMLSRLFRNHSALQFSRPYHAMIDDSVMTLLEEEPNWQIGDLPNVAILHSGYQTAAIAGRNKLNKARYAMERFLISHPGDPYVCNKLGALYLQFEKWQYSVELLERGLQAEQLSPALLYELHYHCGIAYSRLGHIEQAADHYSKAIKQPVLPQLKLGALTNLGSLRQITGDLTGAKHVFREALAIDSNFALAHYNLGMTLKALGNFPKAIDHYQKAIRINPHHAESHQNLGVVLLKLGQIQSGVASFQKAIALHRNTNPQEAERLRQGLVELGFQV